MAIKLLGLLQEQRAQKHLLKLQFQIILYIYSFYISKLKMEGLSPPYDSRVSANLIGGEEC